MTVPDMVCRVCLEPLRSFWWEGDSDARLWQHGIARPHDHEADPVPRSEAPGARMICDFCSQPDPIWSYLTKDEVTHTYADPTYTGRERRKQIARHWQVVTDEQGKPNAKLQNVYSKGWAACEPCAQLIELRDVERLITRVRKVGPEAIRDFPRRVFKEHWAGFFSAIGERVPLPRPSA